MSTDENHSLEKLARTTRGLTRGMFVAEHPSPFLVRFGDDGATGNPRKTDPGRAPRFHTVVLGDVSACTGAASASLCAFELAKRPGSNAFLHMVTLGRAENNDIVIAHPQVSKFHASFTRGPEGDWTLTDASTNGTWVDTERATPRRAMRMRTGTTINFANAVHMIVLDAAALWEELERLRRKLPERVAG